ncbi:MAG: tetratricopeptide repeat protein [Burkholderiaceae bacterium]
MAYDLEEQEQLASLKGWWKQYGNLTSWVVIVVLLGFSGWSGWKYYQRDQAMKAALLYEEIIKAVDAKDAAKVARAAADMKDKFGRTAYAQMGALSAAKSAFDAKDMNAAKAHLQWVAEHGRSEEFIAIAKVRLAGVLLDEKSYDEGLKALSGSFPEQFAALVADRRGDLLVAQNKLAEARIAYKEALDKTEIKNPARQLIQLKFDAIGGDTEKSA